MIRSRVPRCVVVPALAALLAGCTPVPTSSDPAPPFRRGLAPPPAAASACPPDGVRLEFGPEEAAMGLRVLGVTAVNCGPHTYRLQGYPPTRPLAEDRTALRVRVLHGVGEITGSALPWDGPPREVVLPPGGRAGAAIAWRNTYDDTRQRPVTVALLDIAPAPGRPAQLLRPDGGLDLGSTGRLGVSAWRAVPGTGATQSPATPADPPTPGPVTDPAAVV